MSDLGTPLFYRRRSRSASSERDQLGLAAAVLIDATVVRGILLPAALALLGERSWYLPR
jgi:uncharacterized membrane protein YdfJ with MMPL/SSD domain